jgi:predicted outer membrane protein
MRKSIITIVGLCFMISAGAAEAAKLTDGEIAFVYLQANQFDVEEGKLGVARGSASEVTQHGQMVAKDHGAVVAAFEKLLTEQGIKPTEPTDNEASVQRHQQVMDSLKERSGTDFDREYLSQAIIGHRAFIALVSETLLPAASNAALASHLKEIMPAFKQHLAMTIEAAKKLSADN